MPHAKDAKVAKEKEQERLSFVGSGMSPRTSGGASFHNTVEFTAQSW